MPNLETMSKNRIPCELLTDDEYRILNRNKNRLQFYSSNNRDFENCNSILGRWSSLVYRIRPS